MVPRVPLCTHTSGNPITMRKLQLLWCYSISLPQINWLLVKVTMGAIKFIVLLAVVGFVLYACGVFSPTPSIPEFTDNEWWGRGEKKSEDASVVPFKINISEETLRDLKMRLSNARLGEDLEESSFDYGFQVKYMKEVIEYWKTKYDWRKQEAILNSFPNFKTKIEGIDIHFMRVKPRQSKHYIVICIVGKLRSPMYSKLWFTCMLLTGTGTVKPLLLVHGWPGSVWEFYKIIPMLTDPGKYGLPRDMAFEVICPSIPGYGFSEGAHHKGIVPSSLLIHVFNVTSTCGCSLRLEQSSGCQDFPEIDEAARIWEVLLPGWWLGGSHWVGPCHSVSWVSFLKDLTDYFRYLLMRAFDIFFNLFVSPSPLGMSLGSIWMSCSQDRIPLWKTLLCLSSLLCSFLLKNKKGILEEWLYFPRVSGKWATCIFKRLGQILLVWSSELFHLAFVFTSAVYI